MRESLLTHRTGKQSKIRLLNRMKKDVTNRNGPFGKFATGLTIEFKHAVERWVDKIEDLLNNGLESVLGDVDGHFIGPEMPEEERNELRESLKLMMPQIDDVFETKIPLLIEGCKEWA